MLRFTINEIAAEHRMDPSLRALYVEGARDREFLLALVGSARDSNATVRPIASVSIPDADGGGEKGRLLRFAEEIRALDLQVRALVDRDDDEMLGNGVVPTNVWVTDNRDLEGYVLRPDCLAKLAIASKVFRGAAAGRILATVMAGGRELAFLRLVSRLDHHDLPFSKTAISRSVRFADGSITLDLQHYLGVLLQNAGISKRQSSSIIQRVREMEVKYADVAPGRVVHGKDAFALLDVALQKDKPKIAVLSLFMTFDRAMLVDYPVLKEVVAYLEQPP